MKPFTLVPFLLLHLSLTVTAQTDPEKLIENATNRRFILRRDTLYAFYAASPDKPPKIDAGKIYYWISKDTIFATQGGYAGRLLNGEYKVYYPDKSLCEWGNFRYGLKDGPWKTWYPSGSLKSISYWKRGEETNRETEAQLKKPQ